MNSLKKVKPGDPLRIPASTFNAFIDVARDFRARQQGTGQSHRPASRHSGIIHARNDSGADRQRFEVLGVSAAVFSPASDLEAFKNYPAMAGVTPTEADHLGRFVVLLEPIAAGQVGLCMASGVVPVQLYVENDDFTCADVRDGEATSLETTASGSAQVLWREEGTGLRWGLVKLGVGITGTHENPKVLGGSGETADTEVWDVDDQPEGYDGVEFKPFRLYWSGTSGSPVYQFIRTPTYDSTGRLVHVSAEVRSTAFSTGNCQG